ncbi:glycerophosphodiester phosphodiesterase [Aureimonas populi]|uniref:Glycerophosphodiester phosphodiesterase n=1 Tax=Aureimonas populi TaxID=1701758 RepID=A0ABW5CQM2_9HYPH|nr:glycerophosphodiester phosphodiesterase [Aureimonas populi]
MSVQRDIGWLTSRPIAHRGLHDEAKGIHENSISAFRAAIDAGYAIECDVRLSADGVPVVFHDDALSRMTGTGGRVIERTARELGALQLKGGGDHVPRLSELLDLVDGQVPLVVELKGTSPEEDAGFAGALEPLVEAYRGPLALMSFDSWLIEQATAFSDRVPVGLTAEGTREDNFSQHRRLLDGRCSFVSYNLHHLPNPFVEWVRQETRLPVISWTVRSPSDAERSELHADQITFEGFIPRT